MLIKYRGPTARTAGPVLGTRPRHKQTGADTDDPHDTFEFVIFRSTTIKTRNLKVRIFACSSCYENLIYV